MVLNQSQRSVCISQYIIEPLFPSEPQTATTEKATQTPFRHHKTVTTAKISKSQVWQQKLETYSATMRRATPRAWGPDATERPNAQISQPHVINLPPDAPTSLLGWKQYLLGPPRVNYEVKMIDDVIDANRA